MLRRIDVFIALTFPPERHRRAGMSGFKLQNSLAKADVASFYFSTTFRQKDGGEERSWLSQKLYFA